MESVVDLEAEVTLTVMGRHDHATVAGRHLDHHVERVIRSTAKPVLLIPGQTFETPRSFALAFDGSDTARRMLGHIDALYPMVYDELRKLAHQHRQRQQNR